MKITVSHEFAGWCDYWGGNGRRWNRNAGCLFAYYDKDTTLRSCVDQWCEEFWQGGDCDSFPEEVTQEDIREAILASFTDQGRADYDSGALAECARKVREIYADDLDEDDIDEWPVWIILVEIEACPDCNAPSGDHTLDGLCNQCQEKHYGKDSYVV